MSTHRHGPATTGRLAPGATLGTDTGDDTWRNVTCRTGNPDRFFHRTGLGGGDRPRARAKSVHDAAIVECQECPLIQACLKAGQGEHYGIWGGVCRDPACSTC